PRRRPVDEAHPRLVRAGQDRGASRLPPGARLHHEQGRGVLPAQAAGLLGKTMVQLTLPRGSKPVQGKVFKAPEGAADVKTYKVYRYDPEVDETPRWDTYEVPAGDHGPMLLDALI